LVGGFLGYSGNSSHAGNLTYTNDYSTGSIIFGTPISGGVGGFVGSALGMTETFTHDGSSVNITGPTGAVYSNVGGFAGTFFNAGTATVSKCYANGNVITDSAKATNVGGFAGSASAAATITDAFASGNVQGFTNTGGFVGSGATTSITNAFSVSAVTSGSAVYGFNGTAMTSGTLSNAFWDTKNGATGAPGSGTSVATGLTDTQMQTQGSFTGFSFSSPTNWAMSSTYPFLP
jgi:hypothetical protein